MRSKDSLYLAAGDTAPEIARRIRTRKQDRSSVITPMPIAAGQIVGERGLAEQPLRGTSRETAAGVKCERNRFVLRTLMREGRSFYRNTPTASDDFQMTSHGSSPRDPRIDMTTTSEIQGNCSAATSEYENTAKTGNPQNQTARAPQLQYQAAERPKKLRALSGVGSRRSFERRPDCGGELLSARRALFANNA